MDYLLVRRPYLLAHRGASGYEPENTMAAFERAVTLKADGIETDIRASSDGELVLLHDEGLDRVAGTDRPVAELTLAQLRELDFGAHLGSRFVGHRVATLGELLARFGGRLPLCLEVKAPGIERRVVDAVKKANLLRKRVNPEVVPRGQTPLPPVSFTSFSFDSCVALQKAAPGSLVGFLTQSADDLTIKRVVDAGMRQICPRADALTTEHVFRAHDRGLSVRAWGVRSRDLLRQAIDAGADGVTCNWPDWTLENKA